MPRVVVVALVLILVLVAAFLIYVEVGGPRQEYEDFMNRPYGVDNPRGRHCAELARIQSAWFGYPQSSMWEQIDVRYKRECPDSGVEVRDDIQWSPDLPPEPPEEP